jgi:Phosphotransferase enzyme family
MNARRQGRENAMTGVRMDWQRLPVSIRSLFERGLGASIVGGANVIGGFGPAIAARLDLADGRRVFIKAVDVNVNPHTPDIMRREARVAAALPVSVPAPRLLWAHDGDGWVTLVFEHIEGHQPVLPWRQAELLNVLAAMHRLVTALTPSPIATLPVGDYHARNFSGWRQLVAIPGEALDPWSRRHLSRLAALEPSWVDATVGDTLLHSDIRADNILIDVSGCVWIVDWPNACRGAAWFDIIRMAPSVALQGGPDPETLLEMSGLTRSADPAAITAAVVALAGYFTHGGKLADPPGLPTLRAFQRAQGDVCRRWVAKRSGWV